MARVKNPPAGNIMTIHSWKLLGKNGNPKIVPLPSNSLTAPRQNKPKVNPRPIPSPSIKDLPTVFLEAKASALPRITQFTTMSEIKAPRLL